MRPYTWGWRPNTSAWATIHRHSPPTATLNSILARPFVNVSTLAEDSGLIAYPGVQSGNIRITAATDFQGADLICGRPSLFPRRPCWISSIGYRYLRLNDDLNFNELDTFINPAGLVPVGSTLTLA